MAKLLKKKHSNKTTNILLEEIEVIKYVRCIIKSQTYICNEPKYIDILYRLLPNTCELLSLFFTSWLLFV